MWKDWDGTYDGQVVERAAREVRPCRPPKDLRRYQRHLSLPGFGRAAQERLKAGKVLVVGAGGLGCPALLYLAAAGVGRIVVVDSDSVEASNLQRQVLYTEEDVGQPKAEVAARRLRALNSLVDIVAVAERLRRENALDLVGACDVVIDGSDNFATRYLVNDACRDGGSSALSTARSKASTAS